MASVSNMSAPSGCPEKKKQIKGILKTSSSFDKEPEKKEMTWDEMNILATYHPADKEYGHKKIDEPPTPYSKLNEDDIEDDSPEQSLDPERLASKLETDTKAKILESTDSEESEDELETEEERAKRKQFEQKRKMHYNEFQAIKLARQLMENDEEEEEEEDTDSNVLK